MTNDAFKALSEGLIAWKVALKILGWKDFNLSDLQSGTYARCPAGDMTYGVPLLTIDLISEAEKMLVKMIIKKGLRIERILKVVDRKFGELVIIYEWLVIDDCLIICDVSIKDKPSEYQSRAIALMGMKEWQDKQ